jgi:phosphopantothenoylcysteine decarboxylase / phosphopantothenate---cysteine ligase
MLQGRTVVVGVSGGIAAYKACELVRWLKGRGATVIVAMTRAAAEFVTPLTFQALSGNPVIRDLWGDQAPGFDLPDAAARKVGGKVEHVDVAEAADLVVIAPATANLIARLVHGETPDALTSVVLASPAPLVVCPAMDLEMWKHPATQANVRAIAARGAILVGPESGALASGLEGVGRLAAIEAIGAAIERAIERRSNMKDLSVVISAGRTEEPWDPVRVLTNRSSGRMGMALAEAARDRGAHVTLVAGRTDVDAPGGVERVDITTAAEMERAMTEAASGADLVLMAAAVSDYRPVRAAREKIKRGRGTVTLELAPNPDILAGLGARRPKGQVLVGFALETSSGIARARAKLVAKNADLIVLNAPRHSIGLETNRVTLVEARTAKKLPAMTKREVAEHVLDRALEIWKARSATLAKSKKARNGVASKQSRPAAAAGTRRPGARGEASRTRPGARP